MPPSVVDVIPKYDHVLYIGSDGRQELAVDGCLRVRVDNHRQAGRETNGRIRCPFLSFFLLKNLMTAIESARGGGRTSLVMLEHENTPSRVVFCLRSIATTWAPLRAQNHAPQWMCFQIRSASVALTPTLSTKSHRVFVLKILPPP